MLSMFYMTLYHPKNNILFFKNPEFTIFFIQLPQPTFTVNMSLKVSMIQIVLKGLIGPSIISIMFYNKKLELIQLSCRFIFLQNSFCNPSEYPSGASKKLYDEKKMLCSVF